MMEGQCRVCGRFAGRRPDCPWCGELVAHRTCRWSARLIAVVLVLASLFLPVATARLPIGFRGMAARGTVMPGTLSLARPLPRGAARGAVRDRSMRVLPTGGSRHAATLIVAALGTAALAAWLPVLHPFSLAALGIAVGRARLGNGVDWAFGLAVLFSAYGVWIWSQRDVDMSGEASASAADAASRSGDADVETVAPRLVPSRPIRGARVWRFGVPAGWVGGMACLVLLLPSLQRLGLLLASFRSLGAGAILVLLILCAPVSRVEQTALPHPFWSRLALGMDRLLAMAAAGVLGWAGAWTVGDATVRWSPHPLTLTLAGFLALPALAAAVKAPPRVGDKSGPGTGAFPDGSGRAVVPLLLGGVVNLLLPMASAGGIRSVAHLLGAPVRVLRPYRLQAALMLAGFLLACLGGIGIPAGGGAWLADGAGLPQSGSVANAALVGMPAGAAMAWALQRLSLRAGFARRLAAGCGTALRRRLSLLVVVSLAFGTLGLPGLLLLGLACGVGNLPARLSVDPVVLTGVALVPLAFGLPGVADPFPFLHGWLP